MAITEFTGDFAPIARPVETYSPLARLAALHVEAELTARLANLLGRSIVVAGLLAGFAALTLTGNHANLAAALSWGALMLIGCCAIACLYRGAISAPFSPESLGAFAHHLTPALLYCGFAWGAGAFLALSAETSLGGALLFVAAPILAVALLLRETQALLSFILPLLALSSFAALLKPFAAGPLTAAFMLITGAVIVLPVLAMERRKAHREALPVFRNFDA